MNIKNAMDKIGLVRWAYGLYEKSCAEKEDRQKHEEFIKEFNQAQLDLDAARHNYNYAKEPALLEYYIYEIKAAETRLDYYLKMAKQEKLSSHRFLNGILGSQKEKGEGLV